MTAEMIGIFSSPLQLTEEGISLVKESSFEEIFENQKHSLSELLFNMHPNTKYDVQEMARALMDNLREYPSFSSIKTYAFNNGKDFGQILRAGSILLRDYYLQIHPEIQN